MPDYTLNEIVDIILILGNAIIIAIIIIDKQRFYNIIDFLIDIQIIVWFSGLYCVNGNVNVKNDKDVIITYQKSNNDPTLLAVLGMSY